MSPAARTCRSRLVSDPTSLSGLGAVRFCVDFDRSTPDSGSGLGVACTGSYDPEPSFPGCSERPFDGVGHCAANGVICALSVFKNEI